MTGRRYIGFHLVVVLLLYMSYAFAQSTPIAVMDFEGRGISDFEAAALTDRLRNELFRLGTFNVVERGLMEDILHEQDFQLTGCTSNECLVEVGRLLGASQIVGGSISKVGETFTVSARIVSVETGEIISTSDFDIRGELDDMLSFGMKIVALRLAGDAEEAANVEAKYLERLSKPRRDISKPSNTFHLLIASVDGTYAYNGQPLSRQGVLDVLYALNNDDVNQILENYANSINKYKTHIR